MSYQEDMARAFAIFNKITCLKNVYYKKNVLICSRNGSHNVRLIGNGVRIPNCPAAVNRPFGVKA